MGIDWGTSAPHAVPLEPGTFRAVDCVERAASAEAIVCHTKASKFYEDIVLPREALAESERFVRELSRWTADAVHRAAARGLSAPIAATGVLPLSSCRMTTKGSGCRLQPKPIPFERPKS